MQKSKFYFQKLVSRETWILFCQIEKILQIIQLQTTTNLEFLRFINAALVVSSKVGILHVK